MYSGLGFTSETAFAQISALEQLQQIKNMEFDVITKEAYGILAYIQAPGAVSYAFVESLICQ